MLSSGAALARPSRLAGRKSPRMTASRSYLSRWMIATGIILLVVMVACVTVLLWDMRKATQRDVARNLGKLGIAIAEQTTRSIQAMDLSLTDLSDDILAMGIVTPQQFSTDLRSRDVQTQLRQKDTALPQANAFTIIGADGQLVNFSRAWPPPTTDLTDRDYYRYFRAHDDHHAFISKPVQNRGDGDWTVYVVRRVDGPDGSFLGLLLGAIDLAYFQDFYAALTAGTDTTVSMLNRDGTILVNYPPVAPVGTVLPPSGPWHALVDHHQSGSFVSQGILAPGLRVASVHPLLDYPLFVAVSVAEWDALANWRNSAFLAAIGTACVIVCVAFLLRALAAQLVRLERSETSLANQNQRLEIAWARMQSQTDELRASEQHLADNATALETTLGHMSQGIIMVDAAHRVAVFNTRTLQLLDLPADLMKSAPLFADVIAYQQSHQEFEQAGGVPHSVETALTGPAFSYERERPDGRILEIQSMPMPSGGMVRTYTDITERRQNEARVRYFAHHDDLTQLVNRVVFQERLKHAIELADHSKRSIAVFYLDLDRFKQINDTMGHGAGDQLLVEAASRLRGTVRDIDTVARMGGDEFAIIQPLIDQPKAAIQLAIRVLRLINEPFIIGGTECSVGVSIGIAMYPDHARNASELLRNTDIALYRAKADGRGRYRMFESAMDAHQQQLFMLERDMRQALDLQQFQLEYQPIVDIDSLQPVYCEALVRWQHPLRGLLGPAEFIEHAEISRLIIPIGLWVLETACAEATLWPDHVRVTVNLSPSQFNQGGLSHALRDILRRTGLAPSRLVLEITEGLLLEDTSAVMDTMLELRRLGVQFSLDDFGTAHAGLSYLRRFPFDSIKIDKSFIQHTVDQPEARAIVEGILSISAVLKLAVIAEGVETEAQLRELKRMQCRHVQGYFTGRPQSALAIRELFARG